MSETASSEGLDTQHEKYSTVLKPVQRRRDNSGKMHTQAYRYDRVAIEDIDSLNLPDGCKAAIKGEGVYYQYRDEPPILICEKGAKKHVDHPLKRSQKQAYHALSILDSKGLVVNWRQV
jgi:hypothetical protein